MLLFLLGDVEELSQLEDLGNVTSNTPSQDPPVIPAPNPPTQLVNATNIDIDDLLLGIGNGTYTITGNDTDDLERPLDDCPSICQPFPTINEDDLVTLTQTSSTPNVSEIEPASLSMSVIAVSNEQRTRKNTRAQNKPDENEPRRSKRPRKNNPRFSS
ncbi:uncharacterized protein LOC144439810 [Glandiceps talaboti]